MLRFKCTVLLCSYITLPCLYISTQQHTVSAVWVKTIINALKATIPSEQRDRLSHGAAAAAPWMLLLWKAWQHCWVWTRTGHELGLIEYPFNQTEVVKTDQSDHRSVSERQWSRRKGVCVSRSRSRAEHLGFSQVFCPALTRRRTFCIFCPPLAVIGYLKGRSCSVRNDFLSPSMNYAALSLWDIWQRSIKGLYIFKWLDRE